MKPSLVGIFVVIQLLTLGLASDHPQGHAGELCNLEDVALFCTQFLSGDDGDAHRCCQALASANDRGCLCSPASTVWAPLGGDGLCQLHVSWAGSVECSNLAEEAASLPEFVSNSAKRQLADEVPSSQKPLLASSDQFDTSTESGNSSDQNTSEETSSGGGFPGVLAAGMGASFLLSCALVCPCWKPTRKKEVVSQTFQGDISSKTVNSISSNHDNSRSLNRLNSASSFSAYSNTSSQIPPGVTGALTFTMAELMKVTGNFSPSHKIGQGGFGTVYKGKLKDGTVVAVKRAKKDAFETRLSIEFQNELDMLSQVDHLNLVKLIGYLEEEHERILVVEYVPNGNLREHLDGHYGMVLDMATRLDIAIDVAHALTYLHLYADRPIIHRDVKSSNILLTDTFRAKVADFGFSRTGPTGQGDTHVSTQVKGTAGYLDPEYLTTYQLNEKSDVYSFGILVIEIFTGRRPIELKRPSEERVTVRWAFKKFVEGKVMEILDPRIEHTPAIYMIIERLAELAFACSAPTKRDRPVMKKAQEALWNIRKEYQAQLSNDPARSPSHTSRTSRATFSIPETDSRTSPSFLSPRLASPTRSSPNSRLSPSTSNMSSQNLSGR
ncbi:protein MpRLK-Pelle_RLCK-IV [Marchantia polymorpha subsp. ruderalis]|uniref:non-specific serine/threonine protein kinase n=2 Tax=Marchantia polymorpha TaxID=3197 RepID=A0AAF6AWE2_MARPO|nr:hypothetical protein MARPO_0007s0160 [Marchantia polymorpha]BAF79956.1 receptor-like kinase [Marchantia polymorpha]BBN04076.1 hypothetical protein Mp_3g01680 [Marchantia polymorpha subsp. ruderalis]|eukprot:PTQ47763.1 hypothetical protein MARPO_0007s0160 [Marchantia polymorpha]